MSTDAQALLDRVFDLLDGELDAEAYAAIGVVLLTVGAAKMEAGQREAMLNGVEERVHARLARFPDFSDADTGSDRVLN
jgi:hypothetical protein